MSERVTQLEFLRMGAELKVAQEKSPSSKSVEGVVKGEHVIPIHTRVRLSGNKNRSVWTIDKGNGAGIYCDKVELPLNSDLDKEAWILVKIKQPAIISKSYTRKGIIITSKKTLEPGTELLIDPVNARRLIRTKY